MQVVFGRRGPPFPTKIVIEAGRFQSRLENSGARPLLPRPRPRDPAPPPRPPRRSRRCRQGSPSPPAGRSPARRREPRLALDAGGERAARRRPPGPPSLCAETRAVSAPVQSKAKGTLPTACTASMQARPAGRSCSMPVSEFAACSTLARGRPRPSPDPRRRRAATARPRPRRSRARPPRRFSPRPASASAAASVAPEVKTTSPARAAGRRRYLRPRPLDDRSRGPALAVDRGRVAEHVHRREPSRRAPRGAAGQWRSSPDRCGVKPSRSLATALGLVDDVDEGRHRRTGRELVLGDVPEAGLVQHHVDVGRELLPELVGERLLARAPGPPEAPAPRTARPSSRRPPRGFRMRISPTGRARR